MSVLIKNSLLQLSFITSASFRSHFQSQYFRDLYPSPLSFNANTKMLVYGIDNHNILITVISFIAILKPLAFL